MGRVQSACRGAWSADSTGRRTATFCEHERPRSIEARRKAGEEDTGRGEGGGGGSASHEISMGGRLGARISHTPVGRKVGGLSHGRKAVG